jgi:hypothetical protein
MERSGSAAKKYAAYVIAGGALSVPAQATPIGLTVNQTYTANNTTLNVPLDINQDGVSDFSLLLQTYASPFAAGVGLVPQSTNAWVNGTTAADPKGAPGTSYPAALVYGVDAVGAFRTFAPGSGILRSEEANLKSSAVYGDWPNDLADPRYVGLRFTAGTDTYYGWLRIGVQTEYDPGGFMTPASAIARARVYSYAYESTPGFAILVGAGQPADASVPEPSTFALLALGAVGILALKRRRLS